MSKYWTKKYGKIIKKLNQRGGKKEERVEAED